MTCPVCFESPHLHPRGLSKYRAVLEIGVVEDKNRKMSDSPQHSALVRVGSRPGSTEYYCISCAITVIVDHVTRIR